MSHNSQYPITQTRTNMKLKTLTIAGAGVAMLTIGQASGSTISINVGGFDHDHDVTTGTAGVVDVGNWNNLTGAVANPTGTSLIDDSGVATTAGISSSGWLYNTFNDFGDNRKNMLSNFIGRDGDPISSATITLTSIPYATYDVYIYYTAYWMGNGGEIQPWTESEGSTTLYGLRGPLSGGQLTGYQQYQTTSHATALADADAAGGTAGGNYLVFSGLSAANLTLTSSDPNQDGWKMVGLSGIQIVEAIPEPSLLSLLALTPALALRRRRA